MQKLVTLFFVLFCVTAFSKSVPSPKNVSKSSEVTISWNYQNFPLKIEIAEILEDKKLFISETKSFKKAEDSIVASFIKDGKINTPFRGSSPFALTINNQSDKDYYFFAVPHELNPHHASAGHYFECLCNGRVFKVAAHSTWYRIVRLNLNDSFQNLKKFEINHQIIGLEKNEVMLSYKDRLYEAN